MVRIPGPCGHMTAWTRPAGCTQDVWGTCGIQGMAPPPPGRPLIHRWISVGGRG